MAKSSSSEMKAEQSSAIEGAKEGAEKESERGKKEEILGKRNGEKAEKQSWKTRMMIFRRLVPRTR